MRGLSGLGGSESRAFAISSEGRVAGAAINVNGYFHAAAWNSAGVVVDLGTLGGGHSFAYGMNDADSVVGFSYDAEGRQRAFLWVGGVLFELNALVEDAEWSLTGAYGINASGQIVGTGFYKRPKRGFPAGPNIGGATNTVP